METWKGDRQHMNTKDKVPSRNIIQTDRARKIGYT